MAARALCLAWAALAAVAALAASPEDAIIHPGTLPVDSDGNTIHAHGAGFWVDPHDAGGTKYYWIGTTIKQPPAYISQGISCYSSYDLATWKNEGILLYNTSMHAPGASGPWRIERPKVVYNAQTQKFVMWFHFDTTGFGIQSVGTATCDTVCGNYTFIGAFKPDGLASYDMTLFQDSDGSAYLCRSVENQYAGISRLSPDFLNTTGIISSGPRIEGQCIFKRDDLYYLWGSHLTGWSANPAVFSQSDRNSLDGAKWTELGNPSNNDTTYESQSTFILPYTHPNGSVLYIYMGDRWDAPRVEHASYVWLPLLRDAGGRWTMPWLDSWRIGDYTS